MAFLLGMSDDVAAQNTSQLGESVLCGVAVGRRKIENSDSQERVGPWRFGERHVGIGPHPAT